MKKLIAYFGLASCFLFTAEAKALPKVLKLNFTVQPYLEQFVEKTTSEGVEYSVCEPYGSSAPTEFALEMPLTETEPQARWQHTFPVETQHLKKNVQLYVSASFNSGGILLRVTATGGLQTSRHIFFPEIPESGVLNVPTHTINHYLSQLQCEERLLIHFP